MKKITHDHPWTYKMILHYHRCDHCGYILESREDFKEHFGILYKQLECLRCHHRFTVTKKLPTHFGPLLKTKY